MRLGLESSALDDAGFRHAFFMRKGGVSPTPWESLNFSSASGDEPERVKTNLERAAEEMGADPTRIYYLSQVHGIAHQVLDGTEDRERMIRVDGDITVSQTPGVTCAVRMADCASILVADRASGAVAAIHSGWRGTVQGASRQGVRALREVIGGPGDLIAAVGPHIEPCCFEVGPDVASEIADASGLGEAVVDRSRPRPHVDLRRIISHQLEQEGVATIDHVRGCTVCDAVRFHSYRREGVRSGRMLAAVVARSPAAR